MLEGALGLVAQADGKSFYAERTPGRVFTKKFTNFIILRERTLFFKLDLVRRQRLLYC